MLQAMLGVRVDDEVVTLSLEVRNAGAAAESIDFATAQQYEMELHDESCALAWRSSAEQMFAQVLCSRTLGPGARWTFVERWHPTSGGRLRARGWLASTSHRVESSVFFDIP